MPKQNGVVWSADALKMHRTLCDEKYIEQFFFWFVHSFVSLLKSWAKQTYETREERERTRRTEQENENKLEDKSQYKQEESDSVREWDKTK